MAKENLLKKIEEISNLLKKDDYILSEKKESTIKVYLDETIFLLNLSPREEFLNSALIDVFPIRYLAKRLSYDKIITVEDLINKTRSYILNLRCIGPIRTQLIEEWLIENDLSFRKEE